MKWRYMHGQWSVLEDERGAVVADLRQDAAGWWWLRCRGAARRIWPLVQRERRLALEEAYERAGQVLADMVARAA